MRQWWLKVAPKTATRRYLRVFVPAMGCYLAGIFLASSLINEGDPVTALTYVLALVPAVCVWVFIWAQGRYVREIDEFQRKVQVEALMMALMLTMCGYTAWGLLEFYANVPKLPIFYAMPVFYGVFGICSSIINRRHGAGCSDVSS